MKRSSKEKGVVKGAPSGFVISLLVHAGAFVLAGILVVFSVQNKEEKKFVPPKPVERPKMKLKKPQVKVKKNAKPKSSERIVTHVERANMPDIRLPEMSGIGDGVGTGLGGAGFELIPDLEEVTLFGGGQTLGNDMAVTFYNLARRKNGGVLANMSHEEFFSTLRKFVKNGWRKSMLARFYKSPKTLYATTIMIPAVASAAGPAAFGEDMDFGYCWVAHYQGKLVHKDGITFRFWGAADDVLTVAVNKEVVLAANFEWTGVDAYTIADHWTSSASDNRTYRLANNHRVGGDWITLEPGVPVDLDAIAGEGPGGEFNAQLLVEVKGEEYPRNVYGAPIFPIFAMAEPSWELQDRILMDMIDGEANVTNVTTIFRDY